MYLKQKAFMKGSNLYTTKQNKGRNADYRLTGTNTSPTSPLSANKATSTPRNEEVRRRSLSK